jgi:hypothetical protein
MLLITFQNDGTGTTESGNYDVTVQVNYQTVWTGRLEDSERGDWKNMIIDWACELQLDQRKECRE